MELSDLYFSYGTDMDPLILKMRGGRPDVVGLACLTDYRLAFFGYTAIWDSAVETVVPEADQTVWGVLYRMGSREWDRLDTWMDARLDGGGMYFHYPVEVVDLSGTCHRARLYKKDIQGDPQLPSKEYLNVLLGGARQQGLPEPYLEALTALPSRPAKFPVPVLGGREKYIPHDCATCTLAKPISE